MRTKEERAEFEKAIEDFRAKRHQAFEAVDREARYDEALNAGARPPTTQEYARCDELRAATVSARLEAQIAEMRVKWLIRG